MKNSCFSTLWFVCSVMFVITEKTFHKNDLNQPNQHFVRNNRLRYNRAWLLCNFITLLNLKTANFNFVFYILFDRSICLTFFAVVSFSLKFCSRTDEFEMIFLVLRTKNRNSFLVDMRYIVQYLPTQETLFWYRKDTYQLV